MHAHSGHRAASAWPTQAGIKARRPIHKRSNSNAGNENKARNRVQGHTAWMYMRTACEKAMMEAMRSRKFTPRTSVGSTRTRSVSGSSACKGHVFAEAMRRSGSKNARGKLHVAAWTLCCACWPRKKARGRRGRGMGSAWAGCGARCGAQVCIRGCVSGTGGDMAEHGAAGDYTGKQGRGRAAPRRRGSARAAPCPG